MVRDGTEIEESIIVGTSFDQRSDAGKGPIGIGRNCRIRRAIIDRGARIGEGSQLLNTAGMDHADHEQYCIRGGVIVVPSRAAIPPGTVI